MPLSVKHAFQSAKADGADATIIRPSNWNDEHALTAASDTLLGRATAGTGPVEEITCSGFARTILDDADAAAVRTTLNVPAAFNGGTITGDLTINKSAATLYLNGTAATNPGFVLTRGSANRWIVRVTGAESSGDAGADLEFFSYADGGSNIGSPIKITRSTGVVTFSATPKVGSTDLAKVATISTSAPSGGVDGDVWYVVV